MEQRQQPLGQWTTGLCGCFEDFCSCCVGCWCPCVLFGQIVVVVDKGTTSCCAGATACLCLHCLTSLGCLYTCGYRARVRSLFNLPARPCGDCCTDCCCLECSLCQLHRELKNRGLDPTRGYRHVPEFQYMSK